VRFIRLAKGPKSDFAPLSSIELLFIFMSRLEILRRLAKGDNRDSAP